MGRGGLVPQRGDPGPRPRVVHRHAAGRRPPPGHARSHAAQSTKEAVNENLGRELLELHTVGIGSGYTEQDVRSAYILTGRTVVGEQGPGVEGTFTYDARKHWTGAVTVLDFSHENASPEGGLEVGDAYLRHLAAHPGTARTIARKLAVRLVSDMPPQPLVDRLATAYLDSGTAIARCSTCCSGRRSSGRRWARRPGARWRTSWRPPAVGIWPGDDIRRGSLAGLANRAHGAGHRPLAWPAPNGYPDVHAAWRSPAGCWRSGTTTGRSWAAGTRACLHEGPGPAHRHAPAPSASTSTACAGSCASSCSARPGGMR